MCNWSSCPDKDTFLGIAWNPDKIFLSSWFKAKILFFTVRTNTFDYFFHIVNVNRSSNWFEFYSESPVEDPSYKIRWTILQSLFWPWQKVFILNLNLSRFYKNWFLGSHFTNRSYKNSKKHINVFFRLHLKCFAF